MTSDAPCCELALQRRNKPASQWKAEGKTFAVRMGGRNRYPVFQFEDGSPRAGDKAHTCRASGDNDAVAEGVLVRLWEPLARRRRTSTSAGRRRVDGRGGPPGATRAESFPTLIRVCQKTPVPGDEAVFTNSICGAVRGMGSAFFAALGSREGRCGHRRPAVGEDFPRDRMSARPGRPLRGSAFNSSNPSRRARFDGLWKPRSKPHARRSG